MKRALLTVVFVGTMGLGCGGSQAPTSGSSQTPQSMTSTPPAPMLATPYTAEQIRCSSEQGKRLDYWIDAPGKPREMRTIDFIAVDAQGADLEHNTLDVTGHLAEKAERKHATWSELRDHAAFPQGSTKTREEETTVPVGTFPCIVYEVQGPDGNVRTFWFAKTMPGPPVRMQTKRGGVMVEERQLARLIRGSSGGAPAGCPSTKAP